MGTSSGKPFGICSLERVRVTVRLLLAGDGVALPGRDALQRDGTPPQEQNDRPARRTRVIRKSTRGSFLRDAMAAPPFTP